MKVFSYENILDQVTKQNRISRLLTLLIGAFIVGIVYNAYVVPQSLVYGGLGGIAIIVNNLTNMSTTLFINIVTIILIIISILLLGFKKTSYTIIGFLFYTIMINLTVPLAPYFTIQFDSYLFSIAFYSFVAGIGYGLIYKAGFSTGGVDTFINILQKYVKVQTGILSTIVNGVIVICGAALFGITKTIYAIIYLRICNFMSDRVVLGVSSNKICFIKTNKMEKMEEFLSNELEIGYTLLESTNGIGLLKKNIIMCVLPSDRFYDLKKEAKHIDKKVILFSSDCYTVEGGSTNRLVTVEHF